MKKFFSAALTVILAVAMLVSCRSTGEPVLTYGDSVITDKQFTYYLATYKASFLSSYADMEDTAAFYSLELPNGQTGEEYLFDETVNNVSLSLICAELFDQNGLKLDSTVTAAVDTYIQSFVDSYGGGDKRVLNSELAQYGLNMNMLRDVYLLEEKGTALFDYLYGENGTIGVPDETLDAYYRDSFIRVRHIYVNNAYTYSTTEEGYTERDENGYAVTVPLEGEALAAKNEIISAIDTALAAGEDFEALYARYSEDTYYENGYYLTAETDLDEDIGVSVFDLAVGEWVKTESEIGTHYIMRLPYDEKPWEQESNADFFGTFREEIGFIAFTEYIKQYLPDVVKNEEKLAEFSVESSPVNRSF